MECRGCGSITYHDMIRPKLDRRGPKSQSTVKDATKATEVEAKPATPNTTSTSTSSRKRAKSRKGGSLSAMLAKSTADAQSSKPGFEEFDLMDLVKTS